MADRFTFSLVASSADVTGRMAFPANSLSAARPEDLSGDGRGEPHRKRPVRGVRDHWQTLTLSVVRCYGKPEPKCRRSRVQDFPGNRARPSL